MKIRSYYCVRAYNSLPFYRIVQDTLSVIVAFDLGYYVSKCISSAIEYNPSTCNA